MRFVYAAFAALCAAVVLTVAGAWTETGVLSAAGVAFFPAACLCLIAGINRLIGSQDGTGRDGGAEGRRGD